MEGFLFRREFADGMEYMNDDSKLAYLEAILRFAFGDTTPTADELDGMPLDARIAYTFAAANIERQKEWHHE